MTRGIIDSHLNLFIFIPLSITSIVLHRLLALLALFQLTTGAAQEWEFGIQGGASGYMGDINPDNPLAFNEWSAGASVKYNINHTWGIRGNFAYANTFAHDYYSGVQQRKDRYLGFFGSIKEAAVLVDFNFFRWLPQRGRVVYTPYIFAGVGGIAFNPKWAIRNSSGALETRSLRDAMTEGVAYRTTAITIPFGAGFKYNLRGPFSVGVELAYRLAFTDYLDDVSGKYFDYNNFGQTGLPVAPGNLDQQQWERLAYQGQPTTLAGTQRGDGRPYDSFMTVGITLSYTLFKGGCPEWQ